MRSIDFFGRHKFIDYNIQLFNKDGNVIYKSAGTFFKNAKPVLKTEVEFALNDYKKNWAYQGEPVKCEFFTNPSSNLCTIDFITNKKTFINL